MTSPRDKIIWHAGHSDPKRYEHAPDNFLAALYPFQGISVARSSFCNFLHTIAVEILGNDLRRPFDKEVAYAIVDAGRLVSAWSGPAGILPSNRLIDKAEQVEVHGWSKILLEIGSSYLADRPSFSLLHPALEFLATHSILSLAPRLLMGVCRAALEEPSDPGVTLTYCRLIDSGFPNERQLVGLLQRLREHFDPELRVEAALALQRLGS